MEAAEDADTTDVDADTDADEDTNTLAQIPHPIKVYANT